MVPKVAVIALVGILAVPILLGYALNLEQTTETDYRTIGESVNVTPLLKNGSEYTWVYADTYELNNNFYNLTSPIIPVYNKISTKNTNLLYRQFYIPSWNGGGAPLGDDYKQYDISIDYNLSSGYVNALFYDNGSSSVSFTVNRILSFHYDGIAKTLYYVYYSNSYGTAKSSGTHQFTNLTYINYTFNGGLTSAPLTYGYTNVTQSYYADISAGYGFNFRYTGQIFSGENYENYSINLPDYTRSAIITVDLDSITDPNYSFGIGTQCYIEKTTTSSDVSWQVKPRPRISDNIVPVTDLYYDPNGNNTYQIKIWIDPDGEASSVPGYNKYIQHYEFRYIGAWPSFIGEANYYQSFDIQAELYAQTPNFNSVLFGGFSAKSPTIRVDNAEYRGMEYMIIADKNYDPAAFKTNPSTTIDNPTMYGSSITFGGITYVVKKGNITMGNHDIPVKGIVLSSVPNSSGGYDNKIGDTIISNTATPSAITFNGKWSASITTTAQEEYEYTRTEWVAGEFAWDGVDQNFLMVGLLTSLGAFIALGIYARRSKASIWPLLVVCGGAALLFFVML